MGWHRTVFPVATTLTNRTQQVLTFILHAGPHVAELLPVVRQTVAVEKHDPVTGARSLEQKARRLPTSVTLQPKGIKGDRVAGLPNSVLHCPDVQRAMRSGFVDVATEADAAAAPPAPVAAAPQRPDPIPSDLSTTEGRKVRKEG